MEYLSSFWVSKISVVSGEHEITLVSPDTGTSALWALKFLSHWLARFHFLSANKFSHVRMDDHTSHVAAVTPPTLLLPFVTVILVRTGKLGITSVKEQFLSWVQHRDGWWFCTHKRYLKNQSQWTKIPVNGKSDFLWRIRESTWKMKRQFTESWSDRRRRKCFKLTREEL